MKEKVELVLNHLIEVYLNKSEPLSSTKLKELAGLPYSASSIRSYLKMLEKEELVEKEHISSGSYPSVKAMKSFWLKHLRGRTVQSDGLEELSKELDIYVMIEMFENQLLVNVYNLNNKFIILEFENDEVVFRFDTNLYTFFSSVKGIYLDELKKYLLHVGLKNEYKKLKNLYTYISFNNRFLYTHDIETENFEKYRFEKFPKGISFINDCLVFNTVQNEKTLFKHIVMVGNVYTDFFEVTKLAKEGNK